MKIILCFLCFLVATISRADDNHGFVYNENNKNDPFLPLVSPSGALLSYNNSEVDASDVILEGLVTDANGNNLAILNGKIVKSNDQVGPYVVESISKDHVVLVKGQEKLTVSLKKGGV